MPEDEYSAVPPRDSCENELIENLSEGKWDSIFVDLDNALLAEDVTNLFVDSARPRFLAFFLVLVADNFTKKASKLGLCNESKWKDFIRSTFITFFMPWSLVSWRLLQTIEKEDPADSKLVQAIVKGRPDHVTILSYGMRHLVSTKVRSFPREWGLVSSALWRIPFNLRQKGKVQALTNLQKDLPDSKALYITSSKNKIDEKACPVDLFEIHNPSPVERPFYNYYFPFRYVTQAKYSHMRYFRNQILKEEYLLILLAYLWSPANAISLALLYCSVYVIYEIGYWQNDHIASKNEETPSVNSNARKFSSYPVNRAWVWSALFGFAGITWSLQFGSARDNIPPLGLGLLWTGTLVALYVVFWCFNRLSPARRVYLFPFLHFFKVFPLAIVIPITPLGLPLLLSQLFSQCGVYLVYRYDGQLASYNRQKFRVVFFAILCMASIAANSQFYGSLLSIQFILIVSWMTYRVIERHFNKELSVVIWRTAKQPEKLLSKLRKSVLLSSSDN